MTKQKCKYCNFVDIVDSPECKQTMEPLTVYAVDFENAYEESDYDPELSINMYQDRHGRIYFGGAGDDGLSEDGMEFIHYCPMCGRKLTDYES